MEEKRQSVGLNRHDGSAAAIAMHPVESVTVEPADSSEAADEGSYLSNRELDVLYWLALGKTGYETSVILGISLCTVRVHIRNTLRKLGASNIPHAVAR